ncbi:anhydro-N-acetylmuramic acid kinase [Cohaesibacter haloalkalitolerans]|uniref:anhydro-N-acetylmuramic acid kinase n=1 Tax=Cohaesibacter haloalkalitolerans TaxID=1162980 RepID=UPI001968B599|nr:anhydro-N-acetylmuramic acid kinase [Cohaesibacter haloalkalitolerans]
MAKNEEKLSLAIGLMSGTSCDGVDAALIETDGEGQLRSLASAFRPYEPAEQTLLRRAMEDAQGMKNRTARPGCLIEAEALITRAHIEAVGRLMAQDSARGLQPDVIGFHGQTVWHDPASGITVQIGNGQALANACKVPVVHDFRAADVAAGGQGAPLVPIYHKALQASSVIPLQQPLAIINIGGVANITWIGKDGTLTAFDSGPGNALINDWVFRKDNLAMDEGGAIAASGSVDFLALITLMGNPYFRKAAPKSLDRNAFDVAPIEALSLENGAATLTAFTVETICLGLEHMEIQEGEAAKMVVVCGGGQHNDYMMAQLGEALDSPVMQADALGWNGDSMEAEAFGYLAVRSLRKLPLTFPRTTGVKAPLSGGVLSLPV